MGEKKMKIVFSTLLDDMIRYTWAVASASYLAKGCPHFKKVQFFLTLFKRPLTPPPFYLNICPILQGVFFNNVETDMKYM